MESWGVAFLGVIALASVVQAVFLIGLARAGRRLAERVDELQDRIDRDLRPSLESLSRITRNLAEVSDVAALQARRVDDLLADTIDKVEETTSVIRRFVLRPLGPLADLLAFFKGLRRGIQVYQRLSGLERQGRPSRRRQEADADEHLFI